MNGQINALAFCMCCVCACVFVLTVLRASGRVLFLGVYSSYRIVMQQQQSRRWANERKDRGKEENTFSKQPAVVVVVLVRVTIVICSNKTTCVGLRIKCMASKLFLWGELVNGPMKMIELSIRKI